MKCGVPTDTNVFCGDSFLSHRKLLRIPYETKKAPTRGAVWELLEVVG
ncbi:MAG: hypothetical protein K5744_09915 [Eubacterium sp.]|nr:hypothetical protein [Eubacterium sp.]